MQARLVQTLLPPRLVRAEQEPRRLSLDRLSPTLAAAAVGLIPVERWERAAQAAAATVALTAQLEWQELSIAAAVAVVAAQALRWWVPVVQVDRVLSFCQFRQQVILA